MILDKYGVGQDPYCYPGSLVLRNRLNILDEDLLTLAERDITTVSAGEIRFQLPPYDFSYLCRMHRELFIDIYDWAGQVRTVDISKADTRFCNVGRIRPEADKLFHTLANANWLEGCDRIELVKRVSEFYGDLNVIHPFRDGNGRAQRLLFEHLIINAGYQIDWWQVSRDEWVQANIAAVVCDYKPLVAVFDRCIGQRISP